MLQPFDLEFRPFIDEIDAKEIVIRECADAATMKRIKSIYNFTFSEVEELINIYEEGFLQFA